MAVKSQKVGLTTTTLMEDFQDCLSYGNGKDLLVIAQSERHALEHINTLKRLIASSDKYRKYLITKSKELFFKEEKTKIGTIYLKNPDNAFRPTRIVGLPFTEGAIWSWKSVFKIHVSDPAASNVVDDSGVYAAIESRLANTNGNLVIEGPPRGPKGKFYEYYEEFHNNHNPDFFVQIITAEDGVKAGIMTLDFLEDQKLKLGPLYYQYYGASFLANVGNVFTQAQLDLIAALGKKYRDVGPIPGTIKAIGVDPTYGGNSSSFFFTAVQMVDNGFRAQVLHTAKFGGKGYEPPVLADMEKYVIDLAQSIDLYGYKASPQITIERGKFFGQIVLDASNGFYIQKTKSEVDKREYEAYKRFKELDEKVITHTYKNAINAKSFQELQKQRAIKMQKVRGISFNAETEAMQKKMQYLGTTGRLIIDAEKHPELFNELRVAVQDPEGNLLKPNKAGIPQGPTFDGIDSLKLALYPLDLTY
jgi:hypothetical protein